uniref:Uncharacterized protein n=1 Tax=Candidatus Kentrum sp. LPFa TaxID=2126335 RepID=A0A450VNC6_9GAMM|nr:MAG: hypothetical protein BECKLPF1236A_GA0070988_1000221 [Candidatus Kentron sp. LPFa]
MMPLRGKCKGQISEAERSTLVSQPGKSGTKKADEIYHFL